jgi:hypothetical protein
VTSYPEPSLYITKEDLDRADAINGLDFITPEHLKRMYRGLSARFYAASRALSQVDDFLVTDFIVAVDGDYTTALNKSTAINQQYATDYRVNGGGLLLSPDEIKILNQLINDKWVGPAGQDLVNKLREVQEYNETIPF